MADYEVWRPEAEYNIGEILDRLPWVDDAEESALVMVPVKTCGREHVHVAHLATTVGRRVVIPEIVYCLGVKAALPEQIAHG